jgi:hypothetical protein
MTDDGTKNITFGKYLATEMQLRELADNILTGDNSYCIDLLKLFENQELERLQEIWRNFDAQQKIIEEKQFRDDG